MHAYLPCLVGVMLGAVPGAWSQSVNPLSQLVSQALSLVTVVGSQLSAQATATRASTTSTSASSSSPTSTQASSTSSSTLTTSSATSTITSTELTTSSQPASNTAEAAAASSSAAAAVAAANTTNGKNRTTAIVLGVVLGLLALAALIGLLLFCLRRRRRQRAVGSRRSLSSEDVGGASWGKEPLSHSSTYGNTAPSRLSTHERHHTPVGAAAPLMAEKAVHRRDAHGALGNSTPIPHHGVQKFQPDLMAGAPVGQAAHHNASDHIPLSSHSRSNAAAAGLGGAALGGLAAKHHHDKHDERDFGHHANDHDQNISRKPIGGGLGHGGTGSSPQLGIANDVAPGYQGGHSGSPRPRMPTSAEPLGMSGSTLPGTSPGSATPPAYNSTGNPLSSHPPFEENNHKHSTGHEPLMAGAAGVGAGALGGAALAKHHHDENRVSDSSLTGRRSWDPNRQPQHPQSILANAANRRSTGSTNPYVQARSPGRRARFSNDVVDPDHQPSEGNGFHDDLPQNSPYPKLETSHSPQELIRPISHEHVRNGSPRYSNNNHMPGGWRGSGESDRASNHRGSFSNDITNTRPLIATQSADPMQSRKSNPSLSDLRQEEEDGWYRGRYMGDDIRPAPTAAPEREPERFYANANANRRSGVAVGQAM